MDFRVTMPGVVPIITHWVMHNQAAEATRSQGAAGGQVGQLQVEPPLH